MTILLLENKTRFSYFLYPILGITLITIGKDLLHATVRDYHFYLSESLLFGSFWVLFVPFLLINKFIFNRLGGKWALLIPEVLTLLHLVAFALLVFVLSALFLDHTFGFFPVLLETLADQGLACLPVYAIATLFFLNQKRKTTNHRQETVADKLRVSHHGKTLLLDPQDILFVKSETPYIALVTREGTYLQQNSLKAFLTDLAPANFIQIHKSNVINTRYITAYESRKNGDYDVVLDDQHTVRASRSYNQVFKPYLRSG